jgi:uncharacterized ferritin-like protein (DUF455 family)
MIESWAYEYIASTSLAYKLAPPPIDFAATERRGSVVTPPTPGRPPELKPTDRADKARGLGSPSSRARTLHRFFHHELQAAELMCWAVLAYPDAPREFQEGLLRIALDEVRHMNMYAAQIERLGHRVGDFPVRDWFWERVPRCKDPAEFCAVMGLGLESANLEHAGDFAARFRAAGDEESARMQELVGLEEIAHVRFGVKWFMHFRGGLDFQTWSAALPEPLSPMLMRGVPLDRNKRKRAGQTDDFLDELEAWQPRGS